MLEARNGSGTIKAFPRAGVKGKGPVNKANTGLQNKTFHCEICDVHVNSETQLKQVGRARADTEKGCRTTLATGVSGSLPASHYRLHPPTHLSVPPPDFICLPCTSVQGCIVRLLREPYKSS